MRASRQREWLTDALEGTPSLAFFALLRSGMDMETAGWIGAALSALVLAGFGLSRVRFNPLLLGINIHLLLTMPLIVAVFELGPPALGDVLVAHSYKAVLITIFLVGCALALLSRDGFVGVEGLPASTVRAYSAILLAATLAAIVWSFGFADGPTMGTAVPVIGVFGLRRLLIARSVDDSNRVGALVAVGGGSMLAQASSGDAA